MILLQFNGLLFQYVGMAESLSTLTVPGLAQPSFAL